MLIAVREEPLFAVALADDANWATLEKQARATLAKTRDTLAPEARVVVGSDVLVWRGLRHVARHEHRDLLVVGSAHDARDGRVALGRTAGELLSYLECPLGVAPRGMCSRKSTRLERIGVGFDGTPESQSALALASSLAALAGAELEIRRAVDGPVRGGVASDESAQESEALIQRGFASLLEGGASASRPGPARARFEVCVGVSTDILLELCDAVDLLVVGSARKGPAGRVEAGATGRALLHGAPCPVLLAPRPVS